MKLTIIKTIGEPKTIACKGDTKLTIQRCAGTLDGKEFAEMLVKAFNGDAARILPGKPIPVKPDEYRRDGDPPSYMVVPEHKGRPSRVSSSSGLNPAQFCLQQRATLAVAALTQAVEMVKGTDKKAIPLANDMFDWLRAKSLIELEENKVKGDI